ncbi:hypothetical protein [Serratia microhaemolytica]|uniref:hypothetical protein n=1 Tax=Serratia microhaemolytica TaxID=2675110 RepID=UPI000FDDC457|nr:hypothetical protein [Serratia microhaemolytica]
MAGFLYFSKKNGVSLGSQLIDFIAYYLRPYIAAVNKHTVNQVYETYDLFDDTLDFSNLSTEDYMKCYKQLAKAFEVDLTAEPVINGRSYEWAVIIWHNEIKPKMQVSPLYNPIFLKGEE